MAQKHAMQQRLQPFIDQGLLKGIPNRWQTLQGSLEMTPFVLSPDVTSESSYRDHILAHPVVRQAAMLRIVGLDHLSTGAGLSNKLVSVCRHLMITWHEGMPSFDLQVVQSHPNGLAELRSRMAGAMDPKTREDRRVRAVADRLFPDPDAYFRLFLDEGGWIDRAEAFEYPSAKAESGLMPEEFYSLVTFLNYCRSFPATVAEVGFLSVPGYLLRLGLRYLRSRRARRTVAPQ